jgi:hypothetical protein
VLLIEPDGPFAKHDRSLRFCLGRLRWRLSLPPALDVVNLRRPSTMEVPLGYSIGLEGIPCSSVPWLRGGQAFPSEAMNRKRTESADRRGYRVGVTPSVSSTSDLSTLLASSGSSGITSPSAHRLIAIRPANEIALTRSAWCGAISASE